MKPVVHFNMNSGYSVTLGAPAHVFALDHPGNKMFHPDPDDVGTWVQTTKVEWISVNETQVHFQTRNTNYIGVTVE